MTFLNDFKNLFTGFRPYNFVLKRLRARPQKQNQQNKPQKKKYMSEHRYTHTTRKWSIGNIQRNSSKHETK